jgi:YD repeat-containing protein
MTETLPGGATSRTTYRYDAAGRVIEIAHPDVPEKMIEERTYDAGGALTSRRWTSNGTPAGEERFERDPRGRLVAAVRESHQGERMEERRTYQGDRLTGIDWTQPGASRSWRITYDPDGRIVRIDIDRAATVVFTYDARGFPVSRAKNAPPSPLQTIEYDFDQPRETP